MRLEWVSYENAPNMVYSVPRLWIIYKFKDRDHELRYAEEGQGAKAFAIRTDIEALYEIADRHSSYE
jgi:hypothetical protein